MDSKLLERTREKLKDKLSPEEQEALKRCASTIQTHTRIGSILGGGLSIYGMYRRKLWPLRKYWARGLFFGVGGIVVGMQIGLVTASVSCVRTVQALQNPDHLMKALREVQIEMQDARRRPLSGSREWNQRSESDHDDGVVAQGQEYQQAFQSSESPRGVYAAREVDADAFPEEASSESGYDGNVEDKTDDRQSRQGFGRATGPNMAPSRGGAGDAAAAAAAAAVSPDGTSNVWQQIRGENSARPETAWDRLRKTGSTVSPKPVVRDSPFSNSSDSEQSDDAVEINEAPRTKDAKSRQQEEFDRLLERERKGEAEDAGRRRNKFGDYD